MCPRDSGGLMLESGGVRCEARSGATVWSIGVSQKYCRSRRCPSTLSSSHMDKRKKQQVKCT